MLNGYKIKKYKNLVAAFFVLFIAHIPGADQEILKRGVQKKSGSPSFICLFCPNFHEINKIVQQKWGFDPQTPT